jgi:hypothetical protein
MTSLASHQPERVASSALQIAHTILCCGLNLAIGKIRQSGYARYVIALLILNEIRGAFVVYTATHHMLLPWLS